MEGDKFSITWKRLQRLELNNKYILCSEEIKYWRNTEEIRHAYRLKYYLKRENQVILLMITDGKKWHYLGEEKLSALLRGIT